MDEILHRICNTCHLFFNFQWAWNANDHDKRLFLTWEKKKKNNSNLAFDGSQNLIVTSLWAYIYLFMPYST